jgi:hypothetical protein
MGAWGHGSFDNDDALDWLAELAESYRPEPIYAAVLGIAEASAEAYIEAPAASNALAAGEVVAAQLGKPAANLPEDASDFVSHAASPTPRLVAATRKAVARILAASELRDLWAETEHFTAWQSVVQDLSARLKGG